MQITILNGDMSREEKEFSMYLEDVKINLEVNNHKVNSFTIDNMDLKYCTGCWNCWWKTPGKCAIKDNGEEIFRSIINSDFIIFASPLIAGFVSSALKKITDRMVCLLHPYIQLINGESHHRKRYDKYPDFGLILQKEIDTDNEDITILNDIYDRLAINFHGKRQFTKFIEETKTEEIKTLLI